MLRYAATGILILVKNAPVSTRDLFSMRFIRSRLRSLLFVDSQALELMSAWAAFFWGFTILIFSNPFATALGHPLNILLQVFPSYVWGGVALTLGVSQGLGVFFECYSARRTAALGLVVLWALAASTYIVDGIGNPTGWLYLLLAIGCGFAYVQIPVFGRKSAHNRPHTRSSGNNHYRGSDQGR